MAAKPKVTEPTTQIAVAAPSITANADAEPAIVGPADNAKTAEASPPPAQPQAPEISLPVVVNTSAPHPSPAPTQPRVQIDIKMEKVMNTAEEFVAFGQANVEALVKSGQIWSNGLQELTKQVAATAQANLDETLNSFKAFSGIKSMKDALDLQANFARVAFEKSMAESGRLTDATMKLTEQALAPITARVTVAAEKFVRPI